MTMTRCDDVAGSPQEARVASEPAAVFEADLFGTAAVLGDVLIEAGRIHEAALADEQMASVRVPARRLLERLRALCDELLGDQELLAAPAGGRRDA